MNQLYKVIGISLLLGLLAYPTYELAKDFAQTRDLKMQHTSYNYSKYLRYE